MGIQILSIADNKKGFWVVFSGDGKLIEFKRKLEVYGSETGHSYDFFNAIKSFDYVPIEKKIGARLREKPISDVAEFIDIELWRTPNVEHFIRKLKNNYPKMSEFKITDKLITKSFALLRVKLTIGIFDEIVQFKEIARADRPALIKFNPFEMITPDVNDIIFKEPAQDATGILIIDSGIISNHPMLEKLCWC